ncbi:MAG: TIGR01620 family protein [Hyphomicrobiales bacterium]
MTDKPTRRPAAFRLDDPAIAVAGANEVPPAEQRRMPTVVTPLPDDEDFTLDGEPAPLPVPQAARGSRWATLFFAGLGGLVSLGIGLAIDQLIRDLFARTDWLGWAGVAFAALVVAGAGALALRELAGIIRLARITHLREKAFDAAEKDDRKAALSVLGDIIGLYRSRPETARGRAELESHMAEIIDGRDLVRLAERELLAEFDASARRYVMDSAKRVSVVTAVSPRALVDIAFVIAENLRLLRRLSQLYGGRPGTLGMVRLAKNALAHLAVTGSIAIGDSLVQQLIGHGLAAKLSARLGEGVVNGMLTARIGIAAIDVCRPLPFIDGKPPALSDVMSELAKLGGTSEKNDRRN